VVVVLLIDGLQFPEIPLIEVVGSCAMATPLQYGPAALKVGVRFGVMVIVSVVVVAHCPAEGVKVYVVVVVLLIEGDQLPVMPLVEVVGNSGTLAPLQYGPTDANVGVTFGVIVIVSVVVVAHCPAVGVNV